MRLRVAARNDERNIHQNLHREGKSAIQKA